MVFLVIGFGSIGKRHVRNLLQLGISDIIVVDPDESNRREADAVFGLRVFEHLESAFDESPDVAIIATPNHLHVEHALLAAEHGCHLFIEKPLSHSMDRTEELVRRVRDRGLISLVGCNLRFHPNLQFIKGLLEGGDLGEVYSVRVEFGQYLPDWRPNRDYRLTYSAQREQGGGIILDAIHEIDYIRWFIGEVTEVSCFADRVSSLEIDVEDMAAILLRFASGALGAIHVDCVQRVYRRRCHIISSHSIVDWDYTAREVRWYSAHDKEWRVEKAPDSWDVNQMYVDEMRHLLRCLEGVESPALDVAEARKVLAIALAARKSAVERRVFTVPGEENDT